VINLLDHFISSSWRFFNPEGKIFLDEADGCDTAVVDALPEEAS